MLPTFVIDFDSTFVTVEALDELCKIALKDKPNNHILTKQIAEITLAGMEGKIDFPTSLAKRLSLFQPKREDITMLVKKLKNSITPSVIRNKEFFKNYTDNIYIITGGFIEYVLPVVTDFGISKTHVIANSFIFDRKGNVIGYDKKNPLANSGGKAKAIEGLRIKNEIIVVGDGYTDYEIKKKGVAKKFFAFTENINRPSVADLADDVMFNFDELLFLYGDLYHPAELKTGPLVLIFGQIHSSILSQFEQEGFRVKVEQKMLKEKSLTRTIKDATVLIVDSRTQVDDSLLKNANKLLAIGRFGRTTGKINLEVCTKKGIPVFNAPFTNIRSVAELAIGEIIMLSRRVFEKNTQLKNGVWDRTSNQNHEIKGKNLGIIGYGPTGAQLSLLAESLGMHVYFYDKEERASLGNAISCDSMEELLRISDVISLHIGGNQKIDYPLTKKEFLLMRDGAFLVNMSSGYIIDEKLLATQLKGNKLGGVAIDVFTKEPKNAQDRFVSPLQKFPNAILTPHIGGSTEEAMVASGNFVVQKILHYLANGSTTGSSNFPQLSLPDHPNTYRFLHIHTNTPGILAAINEVFGKNYANIEGQYLKTNEHIGYVITDVATEKELDIMKALQKIPETIRVLKIY